MLQSAFPSLIGDSFSGCKSWVMCNERLAHTFGTWHNIENVFHVVMLIELCHIPWNSNERSIYAKNCPAFCTAVRHCCANVLFSLWTLEIADVAQSTTFDANMLCSSRLCCSSGVPAELWEPHYYLSIPIHFDHFYSDTGFKYEKQFRSICFPPLQSLN